MSIEIISIWYNEALMAPLFLKNYEFADHIRLFIDSDTTDNTIEIIKDHSKVSWEYFKQPDMMDDDLLVGILNNAYKESKANWVMAPDGDEFIYADGIDYFLEHQKSDIVFVRFYQPFRNINDNDIDFTKHPRGQRKYGDPNVVKGQNASGKKPIVVRTGLNIKWMAGRHKIWNRNKLNTSEDMLYGQHWITADPCFCIDRIIKSGRDRQSKHNKEVGHSSHKQVITEQQIIDECNSHLYDKEFPYN